LLKGCYGIWVGEKDRRATYEMAENTTSIVNVKFHGKYSISLIIFVIYKFYQPNNFCNLQKLLAS
jgi:hypothetical protein